MTDESKKLFDAPWIVYGEPDDYSFVIQNASEDEIATVFMTDEAKRLARLPELYDALWESIFLINRLIGAYEEGVDFGEFCDQYLKDYGNVPSGFTFEWAQLLEKVRDGK